MPETKGFDRLFSVIPKKRFGKPYQLGAEQLGFMNLGAGDLYFCFSELGAMRLGTDRLADFIVLSGIFRRQKGGGKVYSWRSHYYHPSNPRLPGQQSWRLKFKNAIAAWKGLTQEQKAQYNNSAVGKHMSGYNLFIREFLLIL